MACLATRTGHISSYSCPFDLVSSWINRSKCPLQNRVLGSQHTFFFFLPKNPQNHRFWPKNAQTPPKWLKNTPKRPQNVAKPMGKRHKNAPTWCQIDPKVTLKWPQNDPKMVQNHHRNTPFWSKSSPKMARYNLIGSIMAHKRPKYQKNKKPNKNTTQKPSRRAANCIKILKIYSGCFQTHPLTAHFHRSKRRFWPFLSKISVL